MQMTIEQSQQIIQAMTGQIEDMKKNLDDKQAELAIKAKAEQDKHSISLEKNDLERMKIALDEKQNQIDELKVLVESRYKQEQIDIEQ